MDRMKELLERSREPLGTFPFDLVQWCRNEIQQLREKVADLETALTEARAVKPPAPAPAPMRARSRKKSKR